MPKLVIKLSSSPSVIWLQTVFNKFKNVTKYGTYEIYIAISKTSKNKLLYLRPFGIELHLIGIRKFYQKLAYICTRLTLRLSKV